MAGLRFDSLADMPTGMRKLAANKLVAGSQKIKYHNKKVTADGHTFDSQKEYRRYLALMDALREGVIYDLRLQHNFTLQEGYTTPAGERIQAIIYQADFTYRVIRPPFVPTCVSVGDLEYWSRIPDGSMVIEDVKTRATRTRTYINKYKMMADRGYNIREV